jgi:uncharacterized Fe-S center protein
VSRPGDVHFLELEPSGEAFLDPARLRELTTRALGRSGRAVDTWAVKIQLGPPDRAAAVKPDWAAAVAAAVTGDRDDAFVCDTLSITTAGLETVDGQRALAAAKGFGPEGPAPPYLVADDPAGAPSRRVTAGGGPELAEVGLAGAVAAACGLAVITPVRPHPHAGFSGALTSLGLGLVDRETKLLIHRDIRPRVDTPLCAGCGSCLDVCIFDAIVIRGGRAHIDHQSCTGCGECMNVCFMAGIDPEDASGIPRFQAKVAMAARAVRDGGAPENRPAVFLNLLVRPDRSARGPRRRRDTLGDLGVVAGTDPVAVDRATWDLIAGRTGGTLQAWSGFLQEPGPLLARAAELGLGSAEHQLRPF